MYRNEAEDLRNEIYHLKKQLGSTRSENNLLKVKVRKLQDEILRKDKQIDALFDPRTSPNFRKIIYEKSATYVLNIKERNDELQMMLAERDVTIKKLQNQLEMAKLYSRKCKKFNDIEGKVRPASNKIFDSTRDEDGIKRTKSMPWTSLSGSSSPQNIQRVFLENSTNIKEQYKSLPRDHLLSIIESLKSNRTSPLPQNSRKSSPESDLDRFELFCESPHEEIQQLHQQFFEMLVEVAYLKETIYQLQGEQQKTENVLKEKDTSMDKLAKEIKNLKRPKSRSHPNKGRKNSSALATNIYAPNYTRIERFCTKVVKADEKKCNNKKVRKPNQSQTTKEITTQVEKDEENENNDKCEKSVKIFITKKPPPIRNTIEEENSYEDEIFEEDSESVALS